MAVDTRDVFLFFFSSRRRHTRSLCDWSSDVCSSDLDNSGLSSTDTVNLVAVGVRFADITAADATASFKVEVIKTSAGTKSQSAAIIPNSTTWHSNAPATPWKYPLTLYQDPDSANWTNTTLDSMQIGYIDSAINVRVVAISTEWVLVDYTPLASTSNFLLMV